MATNQKNRDIEGRRRRVHISFLTGLLIVAVSLSVIQYWQKGEVTWLATTWGAIAQFGSRAINKDELSGLNATLGDLENKASHAYDQLSKSASDLSVEQIANSLALVGDGLSGNVMGVTDGGNIKVLDSAHKIHKVRMLGIAAPERGQPLATESTTHLADMIAGKDVFVELAGQDKYGYLLGTVFLGTRDINLEQLKAGFARVESNRQASESKLERAGAYLQAELSAKNGGLGLWAEPPPTQ